MDILKLTSALEISRSLNIASSKAMKFLEDPGGRVFDVPSRISRVVDRGRSGSLSRRHRKVVAKLAVACSSDLECAKERSSMASSAEARSRVMQDRRRPVPTMILCTGRPISRSEPLSDTHRSLSYRSFVLEATMDRDFGSRRIIVASGALQNPSKDSEEKRIF
ncbi:hypothetical protein KM043_009392 [Ampulex compressa]|nr:hypothetical protein KM043_009392 [Ampulex compressa]